MSKKLFVGSLDWNVSDSDLNQAFSAFGSVTESKVIMDRDTGRSRGFGFVTFEQAEDANRAISELDGTELHGRAIRVNEAAEKGGGGGRGGRDGGRNNSRW